MCIQRPEAIEKPLGGRGGEEQRWNHAERWGEGTHKTKKTPQWDVCVQAEDKTQDQQQPMQQKRGRGKGAMAGCLCVCQHKDKRVRERAKRRSVWQAGRKTGGHWALAGIQ